MKRLTKEEFEEKLKYATKKIFEQDMRNDAIHRANRIFGNITDNNVSDSFAIYQEILAEWEREIRLDTRVNGYRGQLLLDHMVERPICPDCRKELFLISVNDSTGNQIEGSPEAKSFWACRDTNCGYESELTNKTKYDWIMELPRKNTDKEIKVITERNREIDKLMPECPKCGYHPWRLHTFRIPKGKRNLYGWKSVSICEKCYHEEFHKETYGQIMKKLAEEN